MRLRGWVSMVLLLGSSACPPATPVPVDAGGVGGEADAAVGVGDAGALMVDAGPAELVWSAVLTLKDGGSQVLVPGPGRVEIGPATKLSLRIEPVLVDYRVRLLDGSDQVVASDDEAQALDGGIDYWLALQAPLSPGRSYSLHLDPEVGPELRDARGATYRDLEQLLKVEGQIEPAKPAPGRKKRH
ncbi:MAG: hypothetical protein K1X89_02740 [Myxococcaceae bacterium]|nr:hypothetical protein [Myxococcaceae bacterium]